MADLDVSESLYFHDPDNNGIEVYRDRKQSEWVWTGAIKVQMVTKPLDINNLLNHESYGTWNGFPGKTSIGTFICMCQTSLKPKISIKICLVFTILHPILGRISLPQIDIIITLPSTLDWNKHLIIVPITLAKLDLTIL